MPDLSPFDSGADPLRGIPDAIPLGVPHGIPEGFDLVEMIRQPEWKTMLLDLIREEKMDPWNIDVSELSEKYMLKINSMQEKSLRIPANAVLACAILLKIKARTLHFSDVEDEMDEEMREKLLEQVRSEREALFLELPLLENPRRLRESAVKLDDLVSAIEEIISKSKAKRNTGRILAPEELKFTVPMPTIDLEKETEKLWEKIQANIDATGTVLFSTLTIGANAMQIVASFIALLFLVNRGKANAFQEEFFGEIFVTVAGTGPN